MDNVEIENATTRLRGIEQILIRMSATEGAEDNEMFIALYDMTRGVRKDIERAVGISVDD